MYQTADFKINISTGESLSSLKETNFQLERMIELKSKAGGGVGGGGGGGGRGGGGGGGGGRASGGVSDQASFAAGLGQSSVASPDDAMFNEYNKGLGGEAKQVKDENVGLTHEQIAARRLRRWQMTVGLQAVGYGLEDMYYSGARGALNNIPFAATGLAALTGMNEKYVNNVSGIAALVATAGIVAYDNREEIAKKMGFNLGSREQSILGLPDLSQSQQAQKEINNAMYYVNKYGENSVSGKRYQSQAIDQMVKLNEANARSTTPTDIARISSLPSSDSVASGELLQKMGLGGDRMASYLAKNPRKGTEAEIASQLKSIGAEQIFDPISRFFGYETSPTASMNIANRGQAVKAADDAARDESFKSASRISKVMAGDANAIEALKKDLSENKLTGKDKTLSEAVLKMTGLSSFDAERISSLRASSANPYANLSGISKQIGSYMDKAGISGEDKQNILGGHTEEMAEMKKRAPFDWQKNFDANSERYKENIAASLAGIEANGGRGNARASQRNNLKGQIYSDLLSQGVPQSEARNLANQLYTQGQTSYQGMKGTAKGMQNGLNTMQNMMLMMGDEQQQSFGEFQQNRMQIQMHQRALRMQALTRSRFGLRGMR